MILPEHRERILSHQRELEKKEKPLLDDQRVEELERLLQTAMTEKWKVRLILYDPYKELEIIGIPDKWESSPSRLRLQLEGRREWIRWEDIIDIELIL